MRVELFISMDGGTGIPWAYALFSFPSLRESLDSFLSGE